MAAIDLKDTPLSRIAPTKDIRYESALGNIAEATTWNKWGYNNSIASTVETVWSPGGRLTRLPSAETLDIVSSSTDDDTGGTGAISVIIYGVGDGWVNQTEVVTLDGTTPVTTTNTWLGVNRISTYLVGSSGSNVGAITATATTAATTQAQIPATAGSTQHAFFFVAADSIGLMDWLTINNVKLSGGGNPIVTTKAFVTSLVSGGVYDIFTDYMDTQVTDFREYRPSQPFVIGEKSLIEFTSSYSASSGASNVRFSLIEFSV